MPSHPTPKTNERDSPLRSHPRASTLSQRRGHPILLFPRRKIETTYDSTSDSDRSYQPLIRSPKHADLRASFHSDAMPPRKRAATASTGTKPSPAPQKAPQLPAEANLSPNPSARTASDADEQNNPSVTIFQRWQEWKNHLVIGGGGGGGGGGEDGIAARKKCLVVAAGGLVAVAVVVFGIWVVSWVFALLWAWITAAFASSSSSSSAAGIPSLSSSGMQSLSSTMPASPAPTTRTVVYESFDQAKSRWEERTTAVTRG